MIRRKLFIVTAQHEDDGTPVQWHVASTDLVNAAHEAGLTCARNYVITNITLANSPLRVSCTQVFID